MPTGEPADRRAALLGGAVVGELDAREQQELGRLMGDDPASAAELDDLRAVAALLTAHGGAERPRAELRDRVLGAAEPPARLAAAVPLRPRPVPPAWQRRAATAAAAVVLLGTGVAIGRLTVDAAEVTAVTGPPGTLGAREPLAVQYAPGVTGDASVVAHTWGTEAVLDVGGLPVGQTYSVAFVDASGTPVAAGSFVATATPVHCRLNAALLRRDAQRLTISAPDGTTVVTASLPGVL